MRGKEFINYGPLIRGSSIGSTRGCCTLDGAVIIDMRIHVSLYSQDQMRAQTLIPTSAALACSGMSYLRSTVQIDSL